MSELPRRRQPPITIRSARAADLLRRLTTSGRSQVEVIEEALEQLASQRKTLSEALQPAAPQDFAWEPATSTITAQVPDFDN